MIMTVVIVGLIFVGEVLSVIRVIVKVNFKKAFDDLKNPKHDRDSDNKKKKRVKEKNLDLLGKDDAQEQPPDSVRQGLCTPKDKMIDWEARNSEEYDSMRIKEPVNTTDRQEEGEGEGEEEVEDEEAKENNKFNELEALKKRLRNTLRVKREAESKKTD
jgi:hypothetical protein